MSSTMAADSYRVDPDDPRAPPQELWDRLTPEERARIVASLPSEFPVSERTPPEGDPHFEAKVRTRVEGVEQRCTELEQQLATEAQRREEAERRLAEALSELEQLRQSQR
jgi:hypothetical protein